MQEIIIDDVGIRIGLILLATFLILLLIYICYKIIIRSKYDSGKIFAKLIFYSIFSSYFFTSLLPLFALLFDKEILLSELIIVISFLFIADFFIILLAINTYDEFVNN